MALTRLQTTREVRKLHPGVGGAELRNLVNSYIKKNKVEISKPTIKKTTTPTLTAKQKQEAATVTASFKKQQGIDAKQARIDSQRKAWSALDPKQRANELKAKQRANFLEGINKAFGNMGAEDKNRIISEYDKGTLDNTTKNQVMRYVQSDAFGEVVKPSTDTYTAPEARSMTKTEILEAMDDDPVFKDWSNMKKRSVAAGYLDPNRNISDTWKSQIDNAVSPYMASQGQKITNEGKVIPVNNLGDAGAMTNDQAGYDGNVDDWIGEYLDWDPANDSEFQAMVSDRTSRVGKYFDTLQVANQATRIKELGGSSQEIAELRSKGEAAGMSMEELESIGLSGEVVEGNINREERELGDDYAKAKEYADSDYAKELQKKSKNYAIATRGASEGYSSKGLYKSGIKRAGVLGLRDKQAESVADSAQNYERGVDARNTAESRAREGFVRNREDTTQKAFASKFDLAETRKGAEARIAPEEENRTREDKLRTARLKEEQLRSKQTRSLTY